MNIIKEEIVKHDNISKGLQNYLVTLYIQKNKICIDGSKRDISKHCTAYNSAISQRIELKFGMMTS